MGEIHVIHFRSVEVTDEARRHDYFVQSIAYHPSPVASVGSRGDAYDNAMAEAWVATFKSELVDGRRFPSYEHAEHETLHWIGFYNEERLHEELGDLPPAEYEGSNIKRDNTPSLLPNKRASTKPRALHFSDRDRSDDESCDRIQPRPAKQGVPEQADEGSAAAPRRRNRKRRCC